MIIQGRNYVACRLNKVCYYKMGYAAQESWVQQPNGELRAGSEMIQRSSNSLALVWPYAQNPSYFSFTCPIETPDSLYVQVVDCDHLTTDSCLTKVRVLPLVLLQDNPVRHILQKKELHNYLSFNQAHFPLFCSTFSLSTFFNSMHSYYFQSTCSKNINLFHCEIHLASLRNFWLLLMILRRCCLLLMKLRINS